MTEYYKVLGKNRVCYHGGTGHWPEPGIPITVEGKLEACRNGLHILTKDQLVDWLGPEIWTVNVPQDTEIITQLNKYVVRSASLVSKFDTWNERTQRLFACDCAEHVLTEESDPKSWNAIKVARDYANGIATQKELAAASAAAYAAYAASAAADYAGAAAYAASAAADYASAAAYAASAAADYASAAADYAGAAAYAASAAAYAASAAADYASAAAYAASAAAERVWQTNKLFEYLNDEVSHD